MRNLNRTFVCIVLIVLSMPFKGKAQDITKGKYTWKASQVTDGRTSSTKNSYTEFVTNASTSVDWIQKNGELKTTFRVTGIEGSWPNIDNQGTITYILEHENGSCRMSFERSASGLKISMDFEGNGNATTRLTFKVDSVIP